MDREDFELNARLNAAYHAERHWFLLKLVRFEKLILLAGSATVVTLAKANVPDFVTYTCMALVYLLTISLIVSNADEQCNEHRVFYSRWNALLQEFHRLGGENIKDEKVFEELVAKYADISVEQPPNPNTSVLIHSQNVVLRDIGADHRVEQSAWNRLFRHLYDGDADNVTPSYIPVKQKPVHVAQT